MARKLVGHLLHVCVDIWNSTQVQSLTSACCAQIFDVITFDMIAMLRLPFVPSCAAFIYKVSLFLQAFRLLLQAFRLLEHMHMLQHSCRHTSYWACMNLPSRYMQALSPQYLLCSHTDLKLRLTQRMFATSCCYCKCHACKSECVCAARPSTSQASYCRSRWTKHMHI